MLTKEGPTIFSALAWQDKQPLLCAMASAGSAANAGVQTRAQAKAQVQLGVMVFTDMVFFG